MSTLLDLALAGYQLEKQAAEEKDTISRKAARVGGALAGGRFGSDVGATVGEGVGAGLAKAFSKTRSAAAKAILPKGIGGAVGAVSGLVVGAKAGHGLVKDIQKKASLGNLAERGIRALPGLAAAGVVGGLAGHITSKDSKGVKPGQESMARKTGRAASTVAGAATGGLAGTLAGIQGTRLGMVAGKGKVQTAMAVGGGLAGAIGGGLLGHKAVREKKASLVDIAKGIASVGKNLVKQNPLAAKAALGGAVAGAAATKTLQTKSAAESVEKKPETTPGKEGTKAQSSLIASAKAEMAKAASKK